jgi:hypothetical protein
VGSPRATSQRDLGRARPPPRGHRAPVGSHRADSHEPRLRHRFSHSRRSFVAVLNTRIYSNIPNIPILPNAPASPGRGRRRARDHDRDTRPSSDTAAPRPSPADASPRSELFLAPRQSRSHTPSMRCECRGAEPVPASHGTASWAGIAPLDIAGRTAQLTSLRELLRLHSFRLLAPRGHPCPVSLRFAVRFH